MQDFKLTGMSGWALTAPKKTIGKTIKKTKTGAVEITTAFVVFALVCGSALAKTSSSASNDSASFYFALATEHGRPSHSRQDQFDCDDKIFSVIELKDLTKGKHHIAFKWIDPHNDTREHTQYPFQFRDNPTRLWAWLSLSRARGAGMLQWVNPAAGMEDFIGPWNVEVRVDGKLVAEKKFEVHC